jgi:hypothetical protein
MYMLHVYQFAVFAGMQTTFLRHSICCRINQASQQWLDGTKQPDNVSKLKAETSEGFQNSTINEAPAEQQQAATAVASA